MVHYVHLPPCLLTVHGLVDSNAVFSSCYHSNVIYRHKRSTATSIQQVFLQGVRLWLTYKEYGWGCVIHMATGVQEVQLRA